MSFRQFVLIIFLNGIAFVCLTIVTNEFGTVPYCQNHRIKNFEIYSTIASTGVLQCAKACSKDIKCISFHFEKAFAKCLLNTGILVQDCSNAVFSETIVYFEKRELSLKCLHNGTRSSTNSECKCKGGFIGQRCERLMKSCVEGWRESYYYKTNKMYNILPIDSPDPISIICRMDWGGRDLVLQRYSALVNFVRPWDDYKRGFCDKEKENCWVGLENLYYLTSQAPRTICFEVYNDKSFVESCYANFSISNESENYKILSAGPALMKQNLPPCILELVSAEFSTTDKDHDDNDARNCSLEYNAPWWFGKNCSSCSPMGEMTPGEQWNGNVTKAHWRGLKKNPYSIKIWLE